MPAVQTSPIGAASAALVVQRPATSQTAEEAVLQVSASLRTVQALTRYI
jgi:hypothetical protein